MPINLLNNMPKPEQKIWGGVYNQYKNSVGPSRAAKLATGAIKQRKKKGKSGRFIARSCTMNNFKLVRSGLLFPDYTLVGYVATSDLNKDGKKVTPSVLESLVVNKQIATLGDVEHERFAKEENLLSERDKVCTDTDTFGLYYVKEYQLEDDRIKFKLGLNKKHNLYNKYIRENKQGRYLGLSAEFNNYIEDDYGNIIYADSMDWSVTQTGNQMNSHAKVFAIIE